MVQRSLDALPVSLKIEACFPAADNLLAAAVHRHGPGTDEATGTARAALRSARAIGKAASVAAAATSPTAP
jgi:hypothetical protein